MPISAQEDFARTEFRPGATRAVVKERERIPFDSTIAPATYRIVADVFVEYGNRGRVATWQLDVQRRDDSLTIFDQQRLSTVERLFRISLDPNRQFSATNLQIHAEDVEITLDAGNVFVASVEDGVTALVLLGPGRHGLGSPLFVLYYPVILAFCLVFSSSVWFPWWRSIGTSMQGLALGARKLKHAATDASHLAARQVGQSKARTSSRTPKGGVAQTLLLPLV